MADDRQELEELRRLDELEKRAATAGVADRGKPPFPYKDWESFDAYQKWHQDKFGFSFQPGDESRGFARKVAEPVGGAVTDVAAKVLPPELAAAAGQTANIATQAVPALFGFRTTPQPVSMTEAPAKWMMQSAVKPSMAARETGDAGRAFSTMLQEGISPTSTGMSKASSMANKLNAITDEAIAASPETVNVKRVVGRLVPSYQRAMEQVNPQADMAAIEAARKAFIESPHVAGKADLPVALAQRLKSGTYASIGDKAYGELGTASVEAQKQLARGLREEVIKKVPAIAENLKKESALRNVMEVSASRALADANKNPLALGTSIAAILHDPMAAAGMWANASTRAKALIAHLLYQGGRPEVARAAATAASRIPETLEQE